MNRLPKKHRLSFYCKQLFRTVISRTAGVPPATVGNTNPEIAGRHGYDCGRDARGPRYKGEGQLYGFALIWELTLIAVNESCDGRRHEVL